MTDLIIIGGGASGMLAGILAAREGLSVTILEKGRQFGKKLSVTGNGKCNFTNARQERECYRSKMPDKAWEIVCDCPVSKVLSLFQGLGLLATEKNGFYYPMSETAGDVVKVLIDELAYLHVKCKTNALVTDLKPLSEGFRVETSGYCYRAGRVLLSTGGMAAPVYGTEGDGYRLAQKLGHHLVLPLPALTALQTGEHPITTLAGLRWNGRIRLYSNTCLLAEDVGELQFTTYGISGIPVMQVSRYAAYSLIEKRKVEAELDFLPGDTAESLASELHKRKRIRCERGIREWFLGFLPDKLAGVLLAAACLPAEKPVETLEEEDWNRLIMAIKGLRVPIERVRGFEAAQTTAGGVPLAECSKNLESLYIPGLYFAGEVLDVDGACGGYNLHWAWASAVRAVKGMRESFGKKTKEMRT